MITPSIVCFYKILLCLTALSNRSDFFKELCLSFLCLWNSCKSLGENLLLIGAEVDLEKKANVHSIKFGTSTPPSSISSRYCSDKQNQVAQSKISQNPMKKKLKNANSVINEAVMRQNSDLVIRQEHAKIYILFSLGVNGKAVSLPNNDFFKSSWNNS
uniref:Uncharacterized protein n=1 Tax=Romanomermis culicivorax TaxID=13658 RepID=A0A915HWF7_ROMCU